MVDIGLFHCLHGNKLVSTNFFQILCENNDEVLVTLTEGQLFGEVCSYNGDRVSFEALTRRGKGRG